MEDVMSTIKILQNSPKGRLIYDNGWDQEPNAVTSLIANVQEEEIDKRNRQIVDNAFKTFEHVGASNSKLHKSSKHRRGRRSFPENFNASKENASAVSPNLLASFMKSKVKQYERSADDAVSKHPGSVLSQNLNRFSEPPRIGIEDVDDDDDPEDSRGEYLSRSFTEQRVLLTPPSSRQLRRKKSYDGSPIFKPSPTFSSSTLTQTHSSTTSDATTATPTRQPISSQHKVSKPLGLPEELPYDDRLNEDILFESRVNPYSFIESVNKKYQDEFDYSIDAIVRDSIKRRKDKFKEVEEAADKLASEILKLDLAKQQEAIQLKRQWLAAEVRNVQECQHLQKNRLLQEEKLQEERKATADALDSNRKAALEAAAKQEQIRIQKIQEAEQKRVEQERAAKLEKERQEKADEAKRLADETALAAAAAAKQKNEEEKQKAKLSSASQNVVPELQGLILNDDLIKYTKVNDILRQFEEPCTHITAKDPTSKAFYMDAVKCINTPLNALAQTNEHDIMKKVEHFSKLLSGEGVSGGGTMTSLFACTSLPNGDYFVMKTLAFRFVKKAEADVTRGKATVQPLATVGVHLCRKFHNFASLVQANMYKLCPFLVPFSYPLGQKSIQEYARELGHELSGSDTAIQQTFLERLKGYCTLYALMVLKFHKDGSFDIADATDFFTLGGAWNIIARTMKLEPQVDVTATVIHTILDVLDDTLYAVYKLQFAKLMRLLILTYLPKIKEITPPAKSGSVSRLQIYVEKKYGV